MRLNSAFMTHDALGEHYVISNNSKIFSGLVRGNDTTAFIVNCLKKDTTLDEIAEAMVKEYSGVSKEKAYKDAAMVVEKLKSVGAITE